MKTQRAFSLVEVVVAMGVVAFGLIAVLALLPLGVKTASDAVNYTRTSMIAQDAALRIRAIQTTGTVAPFPAITNIWYYDVNGHYMGTVYTNALYSVTAVRAPLNSYPTNTAPSQQDPANMYSTQLQAATITVASPVNTSTGTLLSTNSPTTNIFTFYVRVAPNL